MLSLVLAILGIIIGFFFLELGFIFEIIAFFIAKKQRKNKVKYCNYAYYISLIAGILQFIVWVIVMGYTLISIKNIDDELNDKLNEINKKHEATLEYYDMCSEKFFDLDSGKYDNYEEYEKEYNKCIDNVDECFETHDQLDKAKQCADNLK